MATKRPSPAQLSRWYREQINARPECTCTDCGTTGPSYHVQPQHPYYSAGRDGVALCTECINRRNAERKAKRKAELDAMERCCCCNRRATLEHNGTGICGRHFKAARREIHRRVGRAGGALIFGTVTLARAELIEHATAEERA